MPSDTCQFVKSNNEGCKHAVAVGQKFCWQHSHGVWARWRSLTRNQTAAFLIGVTGLVIGIWGLWVAIHPPKPMANRKVHSLGVRITIRVPPEVEVESAQRLIDNEESVFLYLVACDVKSHLEYSFFTVQPTRVPTLHVWPRDNAYKAQTQTLTGTLYRKATSSREFALVFSFEPDTLALTRDTRLGDLDNAEVNIHVVYGVENLPKYDPRNISRVELLADPEEPNAFRLACFDLEPEDWKGGPELFPLELRNESTTIEIEHQTDCTHHPPWTN
jgi:hypothetical protein